MDIIDFALQEDIGSGDVTVQFFTPATIHAAASIVARQNCVLAGLDVAAECFRRVGPDLTISPLAENGASVAPGTPVLKISGSAGPIVTAERTALNFLQRLSGIATLTRSYVEAVEGTGTRILDTRKTTPGLRLLEKSAVAAGGGTNHRMGLHDMVMVKDNHLAAGVTLADLQKSIDHAKLSRPGLRVELEADTLDQVRAFYTLRGVDVILLDNMSPAQLREAVRERPLGILLEASGGITLQTIRAVAETGVDFISVGALTHSATAIDFGLDFHSAPSAL
jgi:nicotinate-nucleotide pyrophosphorylase (carboxylating)